VSVHKIPRAKGRSVYKVAYRDEHGRQHFRTFRTRKEAAQYDAQMKASKARGISTDARRDSMTFRELAMTWRASKVGLRGYSLKRIDSILSRHLLPSLGHLKISQISRQRLQDLVNQWCEAGLKPRTILNHRNVFVPILKMAVDDDILVKNPASGVKYPRPAEVRRHQLEPEECQRLLAACDPNTRLVVWLGLITGLRFQELASLDVSDFDPATCSIQVLHSKTERGVRTVRISSDEAQKLWDVIGARPPDLRRHGAPLLCSPEGKRLHYNNLRRTMIKIRAAANLEHFSLHDLRRTHATALIASNLDAKVVQERMGHASIQTTLQLYAKATPAALQRSAHAMGQYLDEVHDPHV
jgi:integrase